MHDYPPIPPPNWLLLILCSLPLVLGLIVLLWPRRKATFLDPYFWALLSGGILVAYWRAQNDVYPEPPFSQTFIWFLLLAIPGGMFCSFFRMSPKSLEGFFKSFVSAIVISVTVLAFALPSVRSVRSAVNRSICKNNLKQLGLAMHAYHDAHGSFPTPAAGEVSWRVALLRWADQVPLSQEYRLDAAWNSAANERFRKLHIPVFECPARVQSSGQTEFGRSDLAVPIGAGGIFPNATSALDLRDISDGTSNTLLIVEASGRRITWNEPRDVNFDELPIGINLPGDEEGRSDGVLSSYHQGGAQVSLADGGVRFISETIDPAILKSLLLANDGPLPGDW